MRYILIKISGKALKLEVDGASFWVQQPLTAPLLLKIIKAWKLCIVKFDF